MCMYVDLEGKKQKEKKKLEEGGRRVGGERKVIKIKIQYVSEPGPQDD